MDRLFPWTSPLACRVRTIVRVVVAIALSFGALIGWGVIDSGRGFLPQQRRDVWLEARLQGDGNWIVEQIDFQDGEQDMPPAPDSPDVCRFQLQESSMGRTNGHWNSWRANHWSAWEVADAKHDWSLWDDRKDLQNTPMEAAVVEYVEGTVIPKSPLNAIWPDRPFGKVPMVSSLNWTVWQERTHTVTIAFVLAFCLATGIGGSFLVLPLRPALRSTDPAQGAREQGG